MCAGRVKQVCAAVALAILATARPCAGDGAMREYAVEAAFIYNFTQFITWPKEAFPSDDTPFVVAVVGDDPVGAALDHAMGGKNAQNRPIVVKHFPSPDQLEPCQLLYVPQSQEDSLDEIFQKIGKTSVLTVDDSEKFMAAGGGIRFYLEDSRVHFEIDPDATDAARLKISSRLMKLARIYKK